jgi:hypothetical protein
MAYQQDTKFGILDMHFSDNNLDAKFVANDGSTIDHFSLSKTAKKKVIERISEDTFSDTNIRTVSDEKTTTAIPLAGQEAQDGKPSITFKFDEEANTGVTNAKPLAQDGKPSITFKLDEEANTATSNTNAKAGPLAEQEVQEVKPTVTNLDDSAPKDDKPMLLSEEQVKEEQVKPAVTNLDDDSPSTDDKPLSLSQETSDKDRASTLNDNTGKSNVKELGTTDSNNDLSEEDSEGRTINTNLYDPFASLN